jgi:arabinofuranan 3-O-arabinosyltransferase
MTAGRAPRGWLLSVWALAFAAYLAPSRGRQTFDTKLGVNIDPAGFLRRLGELWNPLESFGALRDQYIGYLVPMAPFSLAAHAAGIPVWVTERLWMSLITAAAFWGMVRLAEAVGTGTPASRLAAGAAYALWPAFTILVGSTSVAVLPGALVPWALLPLVRGAGGGSPVTAAARSGVAVALMSGVNAASTLAALVVPGLYLLTRGRRRPALAGWWLIAVALATAWWLLPLLFLGRYGFNFLPYIEQARTTTSTMAATESLRGAGNWVAYLHFGDAWLPAGWTMVSSVPAIAGSALAAALGLAGLARRDLPERRWLLLCLAVGATATMAGYGGTLGGPLHGPVQALLDGVLAPLRNVYKFQPALAVPLALGLAHVLAVAPRRVRWAPAALAVAALAGLATPYLSGTILQGGAFPEVPAYWTQAADFLHRTAPRGHALVVPATAHGVYAWGQPIDDPLEPLADSPWVQRDFVPFGGAGSRAVTDAVDVALRSGARVPGLPAYLARAGVRYVVVRNDLDPDQLGYPPPAVLHATLDRSGFHRVAAFGPTLVGVVHLDGYPRYPAVEVYDADPPAELPTQPATVLARDRTVLVSGGPGDLLPLAAGGGLDGRPVLLAGDPAARGYDGPLWTVTDGQRRADHAFGLVDRNVSYAYTADGTNPPDAADGSGLRPPRQLLPVPAGPANQTVAELSGARAVTASSYGSWLLVAPEHDPVAVFDGNPATAWVEGSAAQPAGQWIRIDFDQPVDLPDRVGVRLLAGNELRPAVTRLRASTGTGSVTTALTRTTDEQPLRLPPGRTSWLRLTIEAVDRPAPGNAGAGIADVGIPGVRVTRYLRPPQDDGAGTGAAARLYAFHRGATESLLARRFRVDRPLAADVVASATAVPGTALDALLDRLSGRPAGTLAVTASSTWDARPEFRPANLADGSELTAWIAGDERPTVHMGWSGARDVDELVLTPAYGVSTRPTRVRVDSPAGYREASVPPDGVVRFPALRTDRLDVSFPAVAPLTAYNPVAGRPTQLPVGLAELAVPAVADLRTPRADPDRVFDLPCGQGPALTIDGRAYPTSVHGRLGDLLDPSPVAVSLCAAPPRLDPGEHALYAGADGPLSLADVTLAGPGSGGVPPAHDGAPPAGPPRTLTVNAWGTADRSVSVGAGPAAYLVVHENLAPGWTATLNGRRLRTVAIDGWQQGYELPAGAGGTVHLRYGPQRPYTAALFVGELALLVLTVLAAGAAGWKRRAAGWRPGAVDPPPSPNPSRRWAMLALATAVLALVGGAVAVAVPVLALLYAKRPAVAPWLAGTLFAIAGAFAVVAGGRGLAEHTGAFGVPAQVCALLALAATLTPAPDPERPT